MSLSESKQHQVSVSSCKLFERALINRIRFERSDYVCKPASVLYKKSKHHYGSIYCVAWNSQGNLIATGSNDKTIKLVKFSPDLSEDTGSQNAKTIYLENVHVFNFYKLF